MRLVTGLMSLLTNQFELVVSYCTGWPKSPGNLSVTLELILSLPPLLLLMVIKLPDPPRIASFSVLASLI